MAGGVDRALQRVGLDVYADRDYRALSTGLRQRLALARVFLSDAALVLLDEPTASLDRETEAVLIRGFRRLAGQGRALVIASHHPAILAMGDRRVELLDGRVTASGREQQEVAHGVVD